MERSYLDDRAHALVERLLKGCTDHNLGSATVAIYDTAWVSMVSRFEFGRRHWLFPECFLFLLNTQLPNGGWESYANPEDGLLNTLAALLAMKKHSNTSNQEESVDVPDLERRMLMATNYIRESLQIWDVDATVHVGFEVLVPALLSMLENERVTFNFPGKQSLENLNAEKLEKFNPEILYTSPNSLLHSLEAFIGRIEYDKLAHFKTFGSMMGSPASTAAYLMECSTWDDEAELYLRKVIHEGAGKGEGGSPSVFPMPIFEVTWIMSTLLQSDFTTEQMGEDNLGRILLYISELFKDQRGLLGFAPSVLADADDTAKAILALNLLGKEACPDDMINHFKSKTGHFSTYLEERQASFSANCNVLRALLGTSNVKQYESEIVGITSFLCESWWAETVKDKWNLSSQYSMMLLIECLVRLLVLWDRGILGGLGETLLHDRIPVILIQTLNRTLLSQNAQGTWEANQVPENTAYGVLTLSALTWLSEIVWLYGEVTSAINAGQRILYRLQHMWTKPQYLWVEKVTYGSHNLSESYCLAAMKPGKNPHLWSDKVKNLFKLPQESISKHSRFLLTMAEFKSESLWRIHASVIEGYTFLPQLRSTLTDILPRQEGAKNAYFDLIPCTWTIVNNHNNLYLPAYLLWDMMVLTLYNFRVDEYMETIGTKLSENDLEQVKAVIRNLCDIGTSDELRIRKRPFEDFAEYADSAEIPGTAKEGKKTKRHSSAAETSEAAAVPIETNGSSSVSVLATFRAVVGHYTHEMLTYPRILRASSSDYTKLRTLLCNFLLSHVAQTSDNLLYATQGKHLSATHVFAKPRTSFYVWAHSTGADSVSCPFSFAFFTCLLGAASADTRRKAHESATDCFRTVHQNYLAEDLCGHLAVMSRLYNDFGSAGRDRIEANVNSINFPEFHTNLDHFNLDRNVERILSQEKTLKDDLLELALYERKCADLASERLLVELEGKNDRSAGRSEQKKAKAVRLFVGVTKLYADLYVARDLSNRIKSVSQIVKG